MSRPRKSSTRRCMTALHSAQRPNGSFAVEYCPNPAAKGSRWCEECRTRLQNYDPGAEKTKASSA